MLTQNVSYNIFNGFTKCDNLLQEGGGYGISGEMLLERF